MKIIDMHCDTLIEGWRNQDESFLDGNFSINLNLLKENGAFVQFFAMYLSRQEMEYMKPWDLLQEIAKYHQGIMEKYSDDIRQIRTKDDIIKNAEEGKVSSLLTVEDGVFLEGNMDRLYEVYDMGVRLITLLWNFENTVGYPSSDIHEDHLKGLKPFGFEVVEEMNRLGMIIDVSHMSEGGFFDVAKHSKAPFVASHSCARALCNHRRNLTDEQLRTIADKGGIVGLNFEKSFLNNDGSEATFDRAIEHLKYMSNVMGVEAVGFGSDFDGIESNGEFVNYSGFTKLVERMEGVFTDDEIDKICYKNALRVMNEILK